MKFNRMCIYRYAQSLPKQQLQHEQNLTLNNISENRFKTSCLLDVSCMAECDIMLIF